MLIASVLRGYDERAEPGLGVSGLYGSKRPATSPSGSVAGCAGLDFNITCRPVFEDFSKAYMISTFGCLTDTYH